jgi:GT2 family glycosyltransferase
MNTKSLQEWLDEVLAVLVLFETPLDHSSSYTSICEGSSSKNLSLDWFIYDNSLTFQEHPFQSNSQLIYMRDPGNAGVSKAYNQGFEIAKKSRKKWLLLVDQDTVFTIDSIEKYYTACRTYSGERCFVPRLTDLKGLVSPFKFGLGNGLRITSVPEGIHSLHTLQFINSGLMISLDAFDQAGGYDEDFPLDFSDFAFVERLKKVVSSFVVIPLTVTHQFSSSGIASLENELRRFRMYYPSAMLFMKKYYPAKRVIQVRAWVRALKLCLKHKTLTFIPLK